jgi:hypothetical protein
MSTETLIKDGDTWSPSVCSEFLASVLEWIKRTVVVDDHRVVYSLSWSPPGGNPVRCESLGPVSSEDERVLPGWFVDKVLEQGAN